MTNNERLMNVAFLAAVVIDKFNILPAPGGDLCVAIAALACCGYYARKAWLNGVSK